MLRNLSPGEQSIILEIELTVEYGGYDPDSTEYKHQGTVQKSIKMALVTGDETPWGIL